MSAEAGPGPSSMASSSPPVPSSARRLRVNKRVINLVNPADPEEFSASGRSLSMSIDEEDESRVKEKTPSPEKQPLPPTISFTPMGIDAHGVKGILRPSGTPGSGNGVRFFPKNRFRIITPNHSLLQETPKPAPPPSPTSNSFLSQLLAVVPTMSPRRSPAPPEPETDEEAPVIKADESWEVPGQEGEVSLVASSTTSFDRNDHTEENEEEEAEPWDGQAEVHCSPLSLADQLDSSISYQALEMPSASLRVGEDVSDLMGEAPLESVGESFSLTEHVRPPPSPLTRTMSQHSPMSSPEKSGEGASLADSNPTIRRQLSPLPPTSRPTIEPETPTPGLPAGGSAEYTSIFADMSAEQAELSWPLRPRDRQGEDHEEDQNDTAFHSALFAQLDVPTSPLVPTPVKPRATVKTPSTGQVSVGETTRFFSPISPSADTSLDSSLIIRPSSSPPTTTLPSNTSSSLAKALLQPTRTLFAAQSQLSNALQAELEFYKSLALRLQEEVTERDGCLAELNLKAVEVDMLRVQVVDLKDELSRSKKEESMSPSPLAAKMRRTLSGDRTTIEEGEKRDLEIRLAKALADGEVMIKQISDLKRVREGLDVKVEEMKKAVKGAEEREQDGEVASRRKAEEVEELRRQVEDLRIKAEEETHARQETEEEMRRLQTAVDEKGAAERLEAELGDLKEEADHLRDEVEQSTRREADLRYQLDEALERADEVSQQLAATEEKLEDVESRLEEMRDVKRQDDEVIEDLRRSVEVSKRKERRGSDEAARERLRVLEGRVEEMAREVELERWHRAEAERLVKEGGDAKAALEEEIEELRQSLAAAESSKGHSPGGTDLPKEITRLKHESALKDLEISSLQRRKQELKDDREMLNIALDSKQQELELIKRKFAVTGVAGSTPLASARRLPASLSKGTPAGVSSVDMDTPAPVKPRLGGGARRSSAAAMYTTPLVGSTGVGSRVLRARDSTARKVSIGGGGGVMGRLDEENRPPPRESIGSVRRTRTAMPA